MLDTRIIDGTGTGVLAKIQTYKDNQHGLVVSTRPYTHYEFKRYPFVSEEFGENLNIPLVFGTPEEVHDGTDTVLWTGTTIVGTTPTFNSITTAYEGTSSISWNNPNVGSIFQLAPSSAFDLSNSIALTMWIYVDSNWAAEDSFSVYAYDGNQVGQKAYLEEHFNYNTHGVWQKITIPLTEMELYSQSITALRFQNERRNNPKSPLFYLDLIQLEAKGTSGLGEFVVKPDANSWFFCKELILTMTDVYNGSTGSLDYKKFLGVDSLDNGINIVVRRRRDIKYQINFKNLGEFLNYGGSIKEMRYDGTSETILVLSLIFDYPIILQDEYQEYSLISINDALDGLTSFKATARGGIEYKVNTGVKQTNVY